jgi:hypothetical protein
MNNRYKFNFDNFTIGDRLLIAFHSSTGNLYGIIALIQKCSEIDIVQLPDTELNDLVVEFAKQLEERYRDDVPDVFKNWGEGE